MSTDATLTSKGQTTIPKPIRDSLRMKGGRQNELYLDAGWRCHYAGEKIRHVSDLAGLLYKKGRKPVPTELLSR